MQYLGLDRIMYLSAGACYLQSEDSSTTSASCTEPGAQAFVPIGACEGAMGSAGGTSERLLRCYSFSGGLDAC